MKIIQLKFLLILGFTLVLSSCSNTDTVAVTAEQEGVSKVERPAYAMVIHGGAGTIKRENMTPERDSAYRFALNKALEIGEEVLKAGGSSRDAVEQTIHYMEDSPLFNAGKGAVFTHEGKNELDASFMDGATLNAGAVSGVTIVKHPISLARAVMEKSDHVMLSGKGAETFAIEQGLDIVAPSYFYTDRRWNSLQNAMKAEKEAVGALTEFDDHKFGTVGCVALDKEGNLVAGTSTGGMTNKRYNRIGDSPIIGAGTYANNKTCGVSSTGHGEYFIRHVVAHSVSALMEFGGMTLDQSASKVVNEILVKAGGSGGIVALDKDGNISMPFNTSGMYRGYVKPGERKVFIYKEDAGR